LGSLRRLRGSVLARASLERTYLLGFHLEATTGIEPVLLPFRANAGLLRPQVLGSPWLDMSVI
jgi:hypothetical protein